MRTLIKPLILASIILDWTQKRYFTWNNLIPVLYSPEIPQSWGGVAKHYATPRALELLSRLATCLLSNGDSNPSSTLIHAPPYYAGHLTQSAIGSRSRACGNRAHTQMFALATTFPWDMCRVARSGEQFQQHFDCPAISASTLYFHDRWYFVARRMMLIRKEKLQASVRLPRCYLTTLFGGGT